MPPVTSRAMSFAILQEQLIRLRGRQVIPARVALGMVLRECGAKNATQARRRAIFGDSLIICVSNDA